VRGGPFKGTRIDVEEDDVTLFMLDFGDATFATVEASFCVRATRAPSLVFMEFYGSDGTVSGSVWESKDPLSVWRDEGELGIRGWAEVQTDPEPWGLPSGVEHLIDCILDDTNPIPSGEHARHVLEIMNKGMVAARTGQTQKLETTF
jgi:predicted dehydrogenase